MIEKNTPIPARKTHIYSNSRDYQTHIFFQVFEGERALTKDNNLLGQFHLYDIPPAPVHVPEIEVTFNIDVNNILTVKAVDLSTNNASQITIANNKGRLSGDEIVRMIREAKMYKAEDDKLYFISPPDREHCSTP